MPRFDHDGVSLRYRDEGTGLPFVLQHGLGATADQPFEIAPADARFITLECRAHGGSDAGDPSKFSIQTFASDLAALLHMLGIERPVLGGISMGAAIALRLAAQNPNPIRGLVLARPAWVVDPAPQNMAIFAEAASHMSANSNGHNTFETSRAYRDLAAISPDNAASVLDQFEAPDLRSRSELLARIAKDGPGISAADLSGLDGVPTLILANGQDAIHPEHMARNLAALIPGARYQEITSKSVSREAYVRDFRSALAGFTAELRDE